MEMAPHAAATRCIVVICPAFDSRPVGHPFQLIRGTEADRTGTALKTACDGRRQVSEESISDATDNLTDDQIMTIAETILCQCSRQDEGRPMSEGKKMAFDKLVAEVHYDIHEMREIKDAIEGYYY